MIFEPNSKWGWRYSQGRDVIMLEMGNGDDPDTVFFNTTYGKRHFGDRAVLEGKVQFDCDDASYFYEVFKIRLKDMPYSSTEKIQIALSAVTVRKFGGVLAADIAPLADLMHLNVMTHSLEFGEIASVVSTDATKEPFDVMCIWCNQGDSICLVMPTQLYSGGRTFRTCSLVRVNNTDLLPFYKMNDDIQRIIGAR